MNDIDLGSMESEEARREAYREALKRQIEKFEQSGAGRSEYDEQQLAEQHLEIEKGKRADAILTELLRKELHSEEYQATQAKVQQEKDQQAALLNLNDQNKHEPRIRATDPLKPKYKWPEVKPEKNIFDDNLLDEMFPKQKKYHEVAPKRKGGKNNARSRGFAYTHGTRDDESGSESESD